MAIADAQGNVISVTTTNNLNFGARLSADGYVLNNAMTNFASAPRLGAPSANAMAPRKRPVTSMAPTIVFDREGTPMLAGGSAGGGPIVDYVAAALIDMLGNGRSPPQALARGHVSTAGAKVQLERGTPAAALAPALAALGHEVEVATLHSGQAFIRREGPRWVGAADPRRDGLAQSATSP
jgi:gamma-glutamyltranspeptidase/glutathione hydrolase